MIATVDGIITAKVETAKIKSVSEAIDIDLILDQANSIKKQLEDLCEKLELATEGLISEPTNIPQNAAEIIKQCKSLNKKGIQLYNTLRGHKIYTYIKTTVIQYGHVLENFREASNDAEKLCILYPQDKEFIDFLAAI